MAMRWWHAGSGARVGGRGSWVPGYLCIGKHFIGLNVGGSFRPGPRASTVKVALRGKLRWCSGQAVRLKPPVRSLPSRRQLTGWE